MGAGLGDEQGLMRSSQLPAAIEADQGLLADTQKQLRQHQNARQEQYWVCYTMLVKSVLALEELVRSHKLGVQAQHDAQRAQRMAAMARATVLKLRVLHKQLLLETYTSDNLAALKVGPRVPQPS